MAVEIKNLSRRKAPAFPFAKAAKAILPGWDISLVFVDAKAAKALNKKLRRKTYVPNVLSYVVGNKSGEIIICPSIARSQAPSYDLPLSTFYLLLLIHAL